MRVDDPAGKREIAGIDFPGDRRISGTDILRSDQKPFGRFPAERRQHPRRQGSKPAQTTPAASGHTTGKAKAVFERRSRQSRISSVLKSVDVKSTVITLSSAAVNDTHLTNP